MLGIRASSKALTGEICNEVGVQTIAASKREEDNAECREENTGRKENSSGKLPERLTIETWL
jgi:hypothetical protein